MSHHRQSRVWTPSRGARPANWYGSDQLVAPEIAHCFDGCKRVDIGCAGGIGIADYLTARVIGVNDVHRHVINLARVIADPVLGVELYRRAKRLILHPDELARAQEACRRRELAFGDSAASLFSSMEPRVGPPCSELTSEDLVDWALDFFVCCWMGHGGHAGKKSEFTGGLSMRTDAAGGGRCEFWTLDVIDFIAKWQDPDPDEDKVEFGGYLDAPWVGAGDEYKHPFTVQKHRDLVKALGRFQHRRILVRYGDAPLIRDLYQGWTILERECRTQANKMLPELWILNAPMAARLSKQSNGGV